MKLLYILSMALVVLCGCANVDPSAADRERNRQMTSAEPIVQLLCDT